MPSPLVVLRRPWSRTRRPIRREHVLAVLWIGTLTSIEVLGRSSETDVGDVAGVMSLLFVGAVTHYAHWVRPIPLVERGLAAARRVLGRLDRYLYRAGQDLRGDPPLPRRMPPLLLVAGFAAPLALAGIALSRTALPTSARDVLLSISPILWFGLLGALWLALLAGCLFALAPPLLLRSWLEQRGLARDGRRGLVGPMLVVSYLLVLLTTASLAPRWVPLALAGGAWALTSLVLLAPRGPRLTILWRPLRGDDSPAALDHRTLLVWGAGILLCVVSSLALLAGGDRFAGAGDPSTALTASVGAFFAWATAIPYAGWVGTELGAHVAGRLRDPARTFQPVVRIVHAAPGTDEGAARAALRRAGMLVRRRDRGAKTDVPVRLIQHHRANEWTWFDRWPLEVTALDLENPDTIAKLERRDVTLRRRQLLRGLRRAFGRIPRPLRRRGVGTWVDPHLWYSPSLARELEGDEGRIPVGPAYGSVLPARSRSHLYHVLRALEVDLVFVERGVRFRQLRQVYETIFETYDVHGGEQRLEERHFRGLVGLRVVLDLVAPHESPRSDLGNYREPDYDGIGRARILHVFRDRGGRRPVIDSPRDVHDAPVPLLTV